MPEADYKDILNATREKTGNSALMLSHQVGANIRSISSGSGEVVGEYDLEVSFANYEGSPMVCAGSYTVNGGTERFFVSDKVTLIDAVNADSVVEFFTFDFGSPVVNGTNCNASCESRVVDVDGIETNMWVFTMRNFTGNASATIRDT